MRGIDFYNLPTTLLSQVDSSIGGKVAIDLDGVKNIVGAFYQPKKVLIDPDTLASLDPRHLAAGMAEAVKMSATFDKDFFETIERADDPYTIVEDIIIPLGDYYFNSSTSVNGAQKAYQFIDDTGTYYREFKSGTLCSVLWQGKMYECVYERSYYGNEGFIGNKSILSSSMEDTGEPFVIHFYQALNRMEIRTNSLLESRTYTIKAYIPKMTITPLHGATSLILLSPGGKRFKITVSDNGTLSTAEVTE
jgi:hypothetical protein